MAVYLTLVSVLLTVSMSAMIFAPSTPNSLYAMLQTGVHAVSARADNRQKRAL